MPGFDRLIEPFREFRVARESTVPFAAIVGDTADVPQRQFQFEQSKRRIDPGAGICQLFEMQSFCLVSRNQGPSPADIEDFRHKPGRCCLGRAQLRTKRQGRLRF